MVQVTRWSPFTPMFQLRRDIDDLFGRVFGQMSGDQGSVGSAEWPTWTPAVEGSEDKGHYLIRAALPGVDPKNVEVSMADDRLIIKGERKRETDVKPDAYFARELPYGPFERAFSLPEGIDASKISARFVHGMLEVTVPKPASEAPRKVAIAIEG